MEEGGGGSDLPRRHLWLGLAGDDPLLAGVLVPALLGQHGVHQDKVVAGGLETGGRDSEGGEHSPGGGERRNKGSRIISPLQTDMDFKAKSTTKRHLVPPQRAVKLRPDS